MTFLFQGVISSMLSMHLSMQAGRFELLLRAILLLFNTVI